MHMSIHSYRELITERDRYEQALERIKAMGREHFDSRGFSPAMIADEALKP